MLHRAALLAAALVAPATMANPVDIVTISVAIDPPQTDFGSINGFYRLRGQSVYFTNRVNSGATGGQLDGFDSRDSELSVVDIQFGEVFPETNLTDYLTFGYFGVIETYEFVEDEFGDLSEVLIDTSIILAINSDISHEELRLENLLGVDEATLLAALTGSFDSPEFFAALDAATQNTATQGLIGLAQSDTVSTEFVRGGESLSLVAFTRGDAGDIAFSVGFLETSILRIVPAPGAAGALAVAGLIASRRRRG